jgi:inner membrane transporter RhtA
MFALTRLPARTFGILMSMEPAIGSLAGWIFLHERLSAWQCAGVLAIVAASVGTTATSVRVNATPAFN